MKLSVVIPAYNEIGTIREILSRVNAVLLEKEIVVVDDCSTDGTGDALREEAAAGRCRLIRHDRNRGKGAALQSGFSAVTGDIVWHSLGNRFLTTLSNMFTNLNLSDMETCYKVFRREILTQVRIEENRFGFEPEITAKVAKLGCRIYEVGITYSGRTYSEGKKINWKDGVRAIFCILKYNLLG
ncbi:MAG: glycosyl transferase [Deltaproteobacteria bacterium]|nr:glycosyl transferase [Deltaproteobacteria bacterium]